MNRYPPKRTFRIDGVGFYMPVGYGDSVGNPTVFLLIQICYFPSARAEVQ